MPAAPDPSIHALEELAFAFSTLSSRLEGLAIPSKLSHGGNSEVMVLVQGSTSGARDRPRHFDKNVKVVHLEGVGVASSRNEALRRSTRRYLLFCDDDIAVDLDGVARALAYLKSTGAAIVLCQTVDDTGALRKRYSKRLARLTRFNSAKAATHELLVDKEQLAGANVWFDSSFGAGVANYLGDEYILIVDALRAGLSAYAVPVVIAMHPGKSSGTRWGSARDRRARAVALNRALGRFAVVGRLLFAVKNYRKLNGFVNAVRFVLVRRSA